MNIWLRIFMALHMFIYRLTGGRLGSRMAGQSVLILETVGRKSGKRRAVPINYFRDGGRYVVVASNWGRADNPAWYRNLRGTPSARIQVMDKRMTVRAEDAAGEEYQRLWKMVTATNDFYVRYQKQTDRKIPLVILIPAN